MGVKNRGKDNNNMKIIDTIKKIQKDLFISNINRKGIKFYLDIAKNEDVSWTARRKAADEAIEMIFGSGYDIEKDIPMLRMDIYYDKIDMSKYPNLRSLKDIYKEYEQIYLMLLENKKPNMPINKIKRAFNVAKENILDYMNKADSTIMNLENILNNTNEIQEDISLDLRETIKNIRNSQERYKKEIEKVERFLMKLENQH